VLLVVCYFAFTNYQNFIPKQQVEVINETPVDNILEKPQAPIVEEFMLSQLEQKVIDLINGKRVKYGHDEYKVNMVLSELGKDYLQVQLNESSQVTKTKVGDLTQRRVKSNAQENIRESIMSFDVSDTQSLVDKIRMSDLYSREMKVIGIAIIEQDNKYNILIDLY